MYYTMYTDKNTVYSVTYDWWKKHVHNLYTYYVKHVIGLLIQCNNCIFAYFLIINLNAYDKLGGGTEVENILKDIFVILCVKH